MSATTHTEAAHALLRRETADWHRAVEEAFAGWNIRSRAGLGAFLTAQARAVFAIEDALDRSDIETFCPDWMRRKRGQLLVEDLRALGCRVPEPYEAVLLDTEGRSLGALYVIEGSRLGGKLLARQIRQSDDPQVRAAVRFFDHEPEPRAWATFRAMLDRAPVDRQHLLEGAERAFACFISAARSTASR